MSAYEGKPRFTVYPVFGWNLVLHISLCLYVMWIRSYIVKTQTFPKIYIIAFLQKRWSTSCNFYRQPDQLWLVWHRKCMCNSFFLCSCLIRTFSQFGCKTCRYDQSPYHTIRKSLMTSRLFCKVSYTLLMFLPLWRHSSENMQVRRLELRNASEIRSSAHHTP